MSKSLDSIDDQYRVRSCTSSIALYSFGAVHSWYHDSIPWSSWYLMLYLGLACKECLHMLKLVNQRWWALSSNADVFLYSVLLTVFCIFVYFLDKQRWGREITWSRMATSTKTGKGLFVVGSTSRHASSVDVTNVRRKPQLSCRNLLLDLWDRSCTALRSSTTLVSVLAEGLLLRSWRY